MYASCYLRCKWRGAQAERKTPPPDVVDLVTKMTRHDLAWLVSQLAGRVSQEPLLPSPVEQLKLPSAQISKQKPVMSASGALRLDVAHVYTCLFSVQHLWCHG
jgi:hypothetical protein